MNFSDLGINKEMVNTLNQNSIKEPTPIQEKVIPELLAGNDVIAQAQTGTGKTLAFLLPILERIDLTKSNVQALIITPTRELALQISNVLKTITLNKQVNTLAAYGGQDVEKQIKKLKSSVHIVIGTPGRLLDHVRRKTVDFGRLEMLVLDEADQMLDMGFLKDIEQIIHKTPGKRQTMLFSATMSREIKALASRYMSKPLHIHIPSKNITLDEVHQIVIETSDKGRQDALIKAFKEYNPFMAIVFCRTKRRVTALEYALQKENFNCAQIHGDLSQAKRENVMKAFRKTQIQYLIATDVAARGLDIEGVTHVFNYDVPQDVESYIHRIGRTGRAGEKGVAVTFVSSFDREALALIEKGINAKIERKRYESGDLIENEEFSRSNNKGPLKTASSHRNSQRSYTDRKSGQGNHKDRRGPGKSSMARKPIKYGEKPSNSKRSSGPKA